MKRKPYHGRMPRRTPKKAIKPPETMDPSPWLRQSLAQRTKDELIDALVEFASDDRATIRRLAARFALQMPLQELLVMTRQAIADATAFDARDANRNFRYDYEAYAAVQRQLQLLIETGHLRPAMELALELMDLGSCQVEASDEGLMTEDIEAGLRPVLTALRECDLSAVEVNTWCAEMLQADRVGCICEQELRELRQHSEASPST